MVTWHALAFVFLLIIGVCVTAFGFLMTMAEMMSDSTEETGSQGCGTLVVGIALIVGGILGLVFL